MPRHREPLLTYEERVALLEAEVAELKNFKE